MTIEYEGQPIDICGESTIFDKKLDSGFWLRQIFYIVNI